MSPGRSEDGSGSNAPKSVFGVRFELGTENEALIKRDLLELKDHCDICSACKRALENGDENGFCKTGAEILDELDQYKEVNIYNVQIQSQCSQEEE